jgi:hypothetical protein
MVDEKAEIAIAKRDIRKAIENHHPSLLDAAFARMVSIAARRIHVETMFAIPRMSSPTQPATGEPQSSAAERKLLLRQRKSSFEPVHGLPENIMPSINVFFSLFLNQLATNPTLD